LLIINKSAGLIVHPGAGVGSGTLANALAFHFAQLSTRAGSSRPESCTGWTGNFGIARRCETEAAHENLAEQFRLRTVFKSYVALVHGIVERDAGRIEQPIARDPVIGCEWLSLAQDAALCRFTACVGVTSGLPSWMWN